MARRPPTKELNLLEFFDFLYFRCLLNFYDFNLKFEFSFFIYFCPRQFSIKINIFVGGRRYRGWGAGDGGVKVSRGLKGFAKRSKHSKTLETFETLACLRAGGMSRSVRASLFTLSLSLSQPE